jgi:hypothetical protein
MKNDGALTWAHELKYCTKERSIGFLALPIWYTVGLRYKTSDKTTVSIGVEQEDDFALGAKFSHKIDEHWTVGVNKVYDNRRKPALKRPVFDLGFDVSYTI